MSIRQRIEDTRDEILANETKGHELREKAIAAIHAGLGSPEWNLYMEQFASTPEELARLQTRDTDDRDPYIPRARAYLVANAICTPGTVKNLLFGIDDVLDRTLS